ncbi:hypothetical protein ABZ208_23540 [Streptomyces sp. NPDC006208]|uniref:hypothetical protein n=1 Tax=Streptomyces sp. NPDC006208 TaxID=3156734 RepID=UPI0033AFE9D9
MIELPPSRLPILAPWFPAGAPGVAAFAEHLLATGNGRWWADRAVGPRVMAVSCAEHVLLRGDPQALPTTSLAPFASSYIEASARFVPSLSAAFTRLDPWERMLYVRQTAPVRTRHARGVTVRRLAAEDAPALAALRSEASWIHATWGGPLALADSRAAFRGAASSLWPVPTSAGAATKTSPSSPTPNTSGSTLPLRV